MFMSCVHFLTVISSLSKKIFGLSSFEDYASLKTLFRSYQWLKLCGQLFSLNGRGSYLDQTYLKRKNVFKSCEK